MGGEETVSGGGTDLKRHCAKDLCCHKIPLFRSWFQGLIVLCLLVFVSSLALSDSDLSWSENLHRHFYRVFNQSRQMNAPAYRVHPKHKAILNAIYKNAQSSGEHPGGLQYHQAYPHNYQFVMDNTEVCKNDTPFLVLMVPVEPKNVAARDAIRQTWGKDRMVQGKVVLTLFMLGLSGGADVEELKQENQQHHDLIQSNFTDTYLNLTIKTMVIMDWLATRCPTAAYAMKVDSDMFLNIDNLVIMLKMPGIPKMNYLTGNAYVEQASCPIEGLQVVRSEELYPDSRYPTYTLGMGYVFSNDLPARFVEVSKAIKPFNIEDAYIGMCIKKLGLSPTSPPNSSQFKAYSSKYNRCEFSKIITYILGSSEQLKNYWADYKKPGPHC